jgi:hypothetical protein
VVSSSRRNRTGVKVRVDLGNTGKDWPDVSQPGFMWLERRPAFICWVCFGAHHERDRLGSMLLTRLASGRRWAGAFARGGSGLPGATLRRACPAQGPRVSHTASHAATPRGARSVVCDWPDTGRGRPHSVSGRRAWHGAGTRCTSDARSLGVSLSPAVSGYPVAFGEIIVGNSDPYNGVGKAVFAGRTAKRSQPQF